MAGVSKQRLVQGFGGGMHSPKQTGAHSGGTRHGNIVVPSPRRNSPYVLPGFHHVKQELMRPARAVTLTCLLASFLLLYVLSRHQTCIPHKENWQDGRQMRKNDLDMADTQFVLESERIGGDPRLSNSSAGRMPTICFFTAPKPPYGRSRDDLQRRALLSWLRLKPPARIVLLGDDPSLNELAAEFPGRIEVESNIDYSFKGLPMFHTIIGRARSAETEISVFINSDILLLRDFYPSLQRAMTRYPEGFLLTGMRWDVNHFPFVFGDNGQILYSDGADAPEDAVIEYVRDAGVLHTHGGVDFWAWNNAPASASHSAGSSVEDLKRSGTARLHRATMPPFMFGRGRYDNWIIHEAVTSRLREVIDASDAVTSIHVAHGHQHLADDASPLSEGRLGNFWSLNKKRSWEVHANIYLSRTTGSFSSQMGTALHIPLKLARCEEPATDNLCITRRVKPASCRCEYSPYAESTQSEPRLVGNTFTCGLVIIDNDYQLDIKPRKNSIRGLPHTLAQLLPDVADANKTVTLVVITSRYRDMLGNFVCRLRSLGVSNVLVVAADTEAYRFVFAQGLAVYYEPGPRGGKWEPKQNEAERECLRGRLCWRHIRLVRWYAMLQILQAGYNVLYSDLDQVWLEDLRPLFLPTRETELLVQSGPLWPSSNATSAPALDIGAIVFAKPHRRMVALFEELVFEAKSMKIGEPLLYIILCGAKGERKQGHTRCNIRHNVAAVFLSRRAFVEGPDTNLWERKQVSFDREERIARVVEREEHFAGDADGGALDGLRRHLAVHINLVSGGARKKMEKLRRLGLWKYDAKRRMCIHPWHRKLREVEGDVSDL